MNGQDSKRVNTLRVHKPIWNEEKQQTEPGDLVWEVPCNIELSDSGCIIFHLEEEKWIMKGDWYLVFPLLDEMYAVPLQTNEARGCEIIKVEYWFEDYEHQTR